MKYNIQKFQLGNSIAFQSSTKNVIAPNTYKYYNPPIKTLGNNYDVTRFADTINYSQDKLLEDTMPLIKEFEKYKGYVYKDGKGIPTIGYGETRPEYIKKGFISEPEAGIAVKDYIQKNILPTLQKKPYFNSLSPNQKVALTSLTYNIGQTKFNNSTKLQRALSNKDWIGATKQMDHGMNDLKNPGLRKRRLFEQELFLK